MYGRHTINFIMQEVNKPYEGNKDETEKHVQHRQHMHELLSRKLQTFMLD
jgi:hypothetical protein